MKNNIRYIARIFIEMTSGFAINSGDKSLLLDNNISRDANGLPYIPGTTIAGILQQSCDPQGLYQPIGSLFGYTKSDAGAKGIAKSSEMGSRLIFSAAHLVAEDKENNENDIKVIDGLTAFDDGDPYYQRMLELPQRDHVRITNRGVADTKRHGKFDRELVYKGTRFCFEVELIGEVTDEKDWIYLLQRFHDSTLRIGSGSRKGMGRFKVLMDKSKYWKFDLTDKSNDKDKKTALDYYLQKSSNLNGKIQWESNDFPKAGDTNKKWKRYDLSLIPKDFFLFGDGFPDADADKAPKKEIVIEWNNNTPTFGDQYLLPATSIKGAIAHRVAYHYNLQKKDFIGSQETMTAAQFGWKPDEVLEAKMMIPETENWKSEGPEWEATKTEIANLSFDDFLANSEEWKKFKEQSEHFSLNSTSDPIGENNEAVAALFGLAKDKSDEGHIGCVIIDDIYEKHFDEKIFNHVKIDRFTGGAYNGALFQEKVLYSEKTIQIPILVKTDEVEPAILSAFESAIDDLKNGRLSLGAATAKGYGGFKILK